MGIPHEREDQFCEVNFLVAKAASAVAVKRSSDNFFAVVDALVVFGYSELWWVGERLALLLVRYCH